MMRDSSSTVTPAKRVLFMSSNGVGMGHLSRLLAVARRLPETIEVVFLTMSQALAVVHQFGFHAEYVPFHLQTRSSLEQWNTWLAKTLDQVLEAYSVDAVVFDGNVVYPGIVKSVSGRQGCPLIWIRRGMWRSDQDNSKSLLSGRNTDLIIEPCDVASGYDSGVSALDSDQIQTVDPIRLLDCDELLSREDCCRTLGMDPSNRYVLIQLGAGNNYNYIDLIGSVIRILEASRLARPVIAEWLTADFGFDLWPRVPRLRCYPISRYYRAFDFTVSAAGYNSFNEILSFGVPSVFVPNLNRAMDDQEARAAFAESRGAAVHLDHEKLPDLDLVLTAMFDKDQRRTMTEQCQKIAMPNGAAAAVKLVVDATTQARNQ